MKNRNERTLRLAILGLFTALIILMAFTPLGYLRTAGAEITFIVIPVALGAVLLGPVGGAILGGVFGLSSFIQCFGFSAFGAALLTVNPAGAFVMCVVTRVLVGWLTGLIFRAINNSGEKRESVACGAACLAAPLLNTVLFTGTMLLFFWNCDYIQGLSGGRNLLAFVPFFVGLNGLLEAAACFIIGTAAGNALLAVQKRLK